MGLVGSGQRCNPSTRLSKLVHACGAPGSFMRAAAGGTRRAQLLTLSVYADGREGCLEYCAVNLPAMKGRRCVEPWRAELLPEDLVTTDWTPLERLVVRAFASPTQNSARFWSSSGKRRHSSITMNRADGPDVDLDASAPACYSDLEEMVVNNTFDGDRYERHSARTRRFVTNVQPYRTGVDNEYAVTSYILLMRSEFDDTTYDIVSAERHDVLRHSLEGLVLARRTVTFDMAILGAPFPNVIF